MTKRLLSIPARLLNVEIARRKLAKAGVFMARYWAEVVSCQASLLGDVIPNVADAKPAPGPKIITFRR